MTSPDPVQIGKAGKSLELIFWLVMVIMTLLSIVGLIVTEYKQGQQIEERQSAVVQDIAALFPELSHTERASIEKTLGVWENIKRKEEFILVVIRDLSIALLVAVFLTITVEVYAGRRLRSEAAHDILSSVFKKIIPDIIFSEVKTNILQAGVLRSDWQIRMRIVKEKLNDNDIAGDVYLSDTIYRYYIQNLMNKRQNHTLSSGLSLDIVAKDAAFLPLPRFTKVTVGDQELEGAGLKLYLNESGNRFSMPIVLGASPSAPTEVKIEVREIMRVPDAWYWATSDPADGVMIHIDNTGARDLEFAVEAYHSNKDVLNEVDTGQQWVFKGGILPWQGFEISVRKRPAAVQESTERGADKENEQ